MKFKSIIDSPCGVRFSFESLQLQSSYARHYLLESEMMTEGDDILASYSNTLKYIALVNNRDRSFITNLQYKLQNLKDISKTISRLEASGNLDDIELFEIKHLSILSSEIGALLSRDIEGAVPTDNVDDIISILDPDGLKISTFYIYDSYSQKLALLRKEIQSCSDEQKQRDLIEESLYEEMVIRKRISNRLRPFSQPLSNLLKAVVEVDIYLAKAIDIITNKYIIPTLSPNCETSYDDIVNPQVKEVLKGRGEEFQPVTISVGKSPTLIIGANMGGKTVVLKTIALCQYLFQFGFGIPAKRAKIAVFDEVRLVVGDGQDELKSLSSFASEMISIDGIIKGAITSPDRRILALIDEPARSTNPIEGTALVSSLISVLKDLSVVFAITTHYNIDFNECNRLKVRGLEKGKMNYELCPSLSGSVPCEALNVAESLNISPRWIEETKKLLKWKVN